jgi:rhamnogalacturonyl hydrolase YesR
LTLHQLDPNPRYLDYAVRWGEHHKWGMRSGPQTRNADDQCCGQTYLELYQLDPKPERIRDIKACLDHLLAGTQVGDWTWIDAIQMGMPVWAKLGVITQDRRYFDRMHAMYLHTKTVQGGKGLYNPTDGLWWRDKDFVPPYKEPNGEDCYWSRGNGWVVMALARVLDVLPADVGYRSEYIAMLRAMAAALKKVQRPDGFWNVSLHDPDNFGGKETSGTAFFAYGLAWGIRHGVLDATEYRPVVARAWRAIITDALHANGFLGYVQGTGKQPSEGQPVTYEHAPDFEDYTLGGFLLAGTELCSLAAKKE